MEEWRLLVSTREALLVVQDQELHMMGFYVLSNCIHIGAWMNQILVWVKERHFTSLTCYKTKGAHILEWDMKLPLNALPRSLIELFLSCLNVSKTPFCVKFHHSSMLLSEAPTSIAICLQTDRAPLLNSRPSIMSGNVILGKIWSFTVVCRHLKLPAFATACPCRQWQD
jgi:hypothetical protein